MRVIISLVLLLFSSTNPAVAQPRDPQRQATAGDFQVLTQNTQIFADPQNIQNSVTGITVGGYHTCAMSDAGRVMCWGSNEFGQLGNGTINNRSTPVEVVGLASDVSAIAAGFGHTCALTASGGVMCWGNNEFGQLGDGTNVDRSTPVEVVDLANGVTAIAAGGAHTCALTSAGGVMCWGKNESGQLGDGTTQDRNTPGLVVGLSNSVMAMMAGYAHTCALMDTGGVMCWGNNMFGQLGDGTTQDRLIPVEVVGLASGVMAIATGGSHTCVLKAIGGAMCWGSNRLGELGDGTFQDRYTPVEVVGLASGVNAITTGLSHTCALKVIGGVMCWGDNERGQLGDNTTYARVTPVEVFGLAIGVIAIAAGRSHTCALMATGGVMCWGNNLSGQLGYPTNDNQSIPIAVVGLGSKVTAIAAGGAHSCALTAAGGAKCWGWNWYGQLGDGTTHNRFTPVDVGLTIGVRAIALGYAHTCALMATGGVMCWGWNWSGQLGDGTTQDRLTPFDVVGLTSGVKAIASGYEHTCALTDVGGIKCWGNNSYGQLGDGTTQGSASPIRVVGLSSGVQEIAAGDYHTCALTAAGGIKCWGFNMHGQLGNGTTQDRLTPVMVVGLSSGATAVMAGGLHTCALTATGKVKCWGYNGYGQLGDGTTNSRSTPVNVVGLASGLLAIAGGEYHTCTLTTTGGVMCWGWNLVGQLGDGTFQDHLTPVEVVGFSRGVAVITAGYFHNCALTVAGDAMCWGSNSNGQLGDGGISYSTTPVEVVGFGWIKVYLPVITR